MMMLLIVFAACADIPQIGIIKLKTAVKNQISIAEANDNAISNIGKPLYVLELRVEIDDEDASSQSVDFFLTDADVATEDVKVEFLVSQSVPTRTNESITLMVNASQLSFVDSDNIQYSTSRVTLGYKEVNPDNVKVSAIEGEEENTMVVSVSYLGANRVVEAGTGLFVFVATWEAEEELKAHPGTYTGEVSLTYLTE